MWNLNHSDEESFGFVFWKLFCFLVSMRLWETVYCFSLRSLKKSSLFKPASLIIALINPGLMPFPG